MRGLAFCAVAVSMLAGVLLAGGAAVAPPDGMFVFQRVNWGNAPPKNEIAIYVARSDGTGVRRLTSPSPRYQASDPVWSPDGARIAYVSSAPPFGMVMNADGSGKRALCKVDACADASISAPAWSPDGTQIAFSLDPFSHDRLVAIVNADGTHLRRVPGTRRFLVGGLDWSPDGNRLAIGSAYRASKAEQAPWGLAYRIWVVNLDGSGLRPLARSAGPHPRWSPDGKTILFTKIDGRGIYTVRPGGGTPKLVHDARANARMSSASWSAAGTEIVFFQGHDLHVLRLADRHDRIVELRPPVCAGDFVCFDVDRQPSRGPTTVPAAT